MAQPLYLSQNFSTTLNVSGGINNSQTSGIVLTSVTGLNTSGGVLCLTWADPLDTSVHEYILYTGVSGNELTGVTRGYEGSSARAHSNGATVAAVVSKNHVNILSDKLRGVDTTAIEDANGNELLKTSTTASAVNEVTITNAATGNAPQIAATGGDTNVGLDLSSKGTGSVTLWTGAKAREALILPNTASAVNEVTITQAATTNAPQISATGDDTNIDLKLVGKGTGKVLIDSQYGALTSNSDGATVTFNMATSNKHTVTLGGNRTLAVSNVSVGQVFLIRLVQDGTGSRTVTWFSTIRWAGGSPPTLTTTASKADTFGFLCISSGNYAGFVIGQND